MSHYLRSTTGRYVEVTADISIVGNTKTTEVFNSVGEKIGILVDDRYFVNNQDASELFEVKEIHYLFTLKGLIPRVIKLDEPEKMTFFQIVERIVAMTAEFGKSKPFYRDPEDAVWHTTKLVNGVLTFENDT